MLKEECVIIICIVILTVAVFWIIYKKMKDGMGPYNIRVIGITFIASLVSILSISGIESTNLNATYTILGAIVGYLFGLKGTKDD